MEIRLPTQLIPTAIEKLESDLSTTQDADNVNVNFSYLTFSKPLGMLVTGSLIRRWINYRRERGLRTTKSGINAKINAHSYLMHLGFFDYIGMNDVGSKIGAARGNTRYLPIRKVVREDLEKSVEETGEQLIDAIIFLADGLANVLSGSDTGEIKKSFSYSIREIIRNALEHSGSDVCYICGQRWVNGHSEIAIVDEGSGVYETLSNVYDVDDSKMLLHALKPGVSRTTGMSEEDNIYNNSGFGLYVLSELGNSFGWFCLGSGTRKLTYQDNEYALIKSPFQGTFVGIHLNEHPKQFAGVLSDIISVGEEEAKIEGRYSAASEISKTV